MPTKLSKRAVALFMNEDHPAEAVLSDSQVPGLQLRRRNGRGVYLLRYRFAGRRVKMTLGPVEQLSPDDARELAAAGLRSVKVGIDPQVARAESRAAPSVSDLCDSYLQEHADPNTSASSARNDRTRIRLYIKPKLGKMRADAVVHDDIRKLVQSVGAKHPTQANRLLAQLRSMFNLAERWGTRPQGSNPCRWVKPFRRPARRMALAPDAVSRLGRVVEQWEAERGESWRVGPLVTLLILTGGRLGEIRTARLERLDRDARQLWVPENKEGNPDKTLPVGELALAILDRLAAEQVGGWFFPSTRRADQAMVNVYKPWGEIRARAELPAGLHLHDLRHTFAGVALGLGISLDAVGSVLGHSNPSTTQIYAYLVGDARTAMVDRVAVAVTEARDRIVPLKR